MVRAVMLLHRVFVRSRHSFSVFFAIALLGSCVSVPVAVPHNNPEVVKFELKARLINYTLSGNLDYAGASVSADVEITNLSNFPKQVVINSIEFEYGRAVAGKQINETFSLDAGASRRVSTTDKVSRQALPDRIRLTIDGGKILTLNIPLI